jgi:cob(I)alamin adenosyltransferase
MKHYYKTGRPIIDKDIKFVKRLLKKKPIKFDAVYWFLNDIELEITNIRKYQHKHGTFFINGLTQQDSKTSQRFRDLKEEDITGLELAMDKMNEVLAPMKSFIIPGGHQAISTAHIARCVCRRAERWCVNMQEEDLFVEILVIKYLNRLSDYLFTLARYIGHMNGVADLPWKPRI